MANRPKTKEHIKEAVCQAIDNSREEIIGLGNQILLEPELGYKEYTTSHHVSKALRRMGLQVRDKVALTGVKGYLPASRPGPTVAIIGELDAVITPRHPYSDLATHAAHSCGHNAQIASMIGATIGLVNSPCLEFMSGQVVFFATPAEEFIEIEFRLNLQKTGEIGFLGGKPELIRLGEFDDIDVALMIHSESVKENYQLGVGNQTLAFMAKHVEYFGNSGHASLNVKEGVNALSAALIGLNAIHTVRESFPPEAHIYIHSIITKGGDAVNVIPDHVVLEIMVRALDDQTLLWASEKADRALEAGAHALDAKLTIENIPGYSQLENNRVLAEIFAQNAVKLIGVESFLGQSNDVDSVSDDIGDVSQLMPTLKGLSFGWTGTPHSPDFLISDPEIAYILPAKAMAMTVIDLLWDDARLGTEIIEHHKCPLTKKEYVEIKKDMGKIKVYQT